MNKKYFRPFIVFFLILFAGQTAQTAEPASQEASADLVYQISNETIKILTNGDDKKGKQARIRKLLVKNLDIDRIGRLIAGRTYRKASNDQKARYNPAIRNYIEIKYSNLLSNYNGQAIEILNTGRAGKNDALVNTRILRPDDAPVAVSWRVSNRHEKLMILDVVVEGISMLQTERQQFESVLQSQKFEGLIETLENKVTKMTEGSKLD